MGWNRDGTIRRKSGIRYRELGRDRRRRKRRGWSGGDERKRRLVRDGVVVRWK